VPTSDDSRVISAATDNSVRVWRLDTGAEEVKLWRDPEGSSYASVSGHLWTAALLPGDHSVLVANFSFDWEIEAIAQGGGGGSVRSHRWTNTVAVAPAYRRALAAAGHTTLKLWDLERGTTIRELRTCTGPITAVAITSDGKRALTACYAPILQLWDLELGMELHYLEGGPHDQARMIALTPDGGRALFASCNRLLYLWHFESGEIHLLAEHSDFIDRAIMSSDGRRAITVSRDHFVKVWDLTVRADRRPLPGHEHRVRAVAGVPGRREAVSVGDDGLLRIWNLETGDELGALPSFSAVARALMVTAEGRAIAVGMDHTVVV
jgi:WD40 repeat protein